MDGVRLELYMRLEQDARVALRWQESAPLPAWEAIDRFARPLFAEFARYPAIE